MRHSPARSSKPVSGATSACVTLSPYRRLAPRWSHRHILHVAATPLLRFSTRLPVRNRADIVVIFRPRSHALRRVIGSIALGLGVALFVIGLAARPVIYDRLATVPLDQNSVSISEGEGMTALRLGRPTRRPRVTTG